MKFVQHIAEYIHSNELELEHLTIVLPSERLKKYISSALFQEYGQPIIAPKMITIDQWVKSYSPETVIDQTRALLRLFEIQLKNAKTIEDASFDEFFTWGTILLSDFNEIDRYLLDADQVFRNLADIKEIENWSFGEKELTESQKRFMEFWDRLPGYYKALNAELSKREICYAGKAFNYLANNINALFEDKKAQYLFAGFNALSKAEIELIRQLDKMGRAHVLINADDWYYADKDHEAGRFLRDLSTALDGRKLDFVQDELAGKAMRIEMISCAQKTGQAKVAATILEKLTKEELDETVLLLADESLIGAVIKNLPASIGKANITLGLPIRNTAVKTWVDLLFNIQENKTRFRTNAIYFNDLQSFWNHPFVLAVLDKEEKEALLDAERAIISRNSIFVNVKNMTVGPKTAELLGFITEPWNNNWLNGLKIIRSLSTELYKGLQEEFAFEKAMLEAFDHSLVEFENILSEGIPEMSLKSYRQLFNMHWGARSIAYHGNPLDGLQIMGLLETRGLDFKRIICLGMNEGNLPPTNPMQTMIPMDLRRYLGLPSPREKQGLFAHHFYRLMHKCEELYVTYSSANEMIGSNEPSRYLLQLEMELSRINPKVKIEKKIYSLDSKSRETQREIPKTPEIIARMDELFAGSASASMLKKYLTCPLDFYFRYVMDFGEADTVEEEIETSTFGTFIHDTLEILYEPFARYTKDGELKSPQPTNITSRDIDYMLKNFTVTLDNQFLTHFNNDRDAFTKGKNLLSYEMAKELTKRFLKSEKVFLEQQSEPVFIEALEQSYNVEVEVEVHGTKKKVNLRGFIDRIDRVGDAIRIIDYKTGKVADADVALRVKDVEDEMIVETMGMRKHVLQLVMYAYLYQQKHGVIPTSSIISFVSNANEPFKLNTQKMDLEEMIENFPKYIGLILEGIYDVDVPFSHNKDQFVSYCQYCD
ncbi:MAG: PD-(D/E)XK nuclease family protein [Crocinitomicaceae bacterium]|nr:PD-(D/E)XK nuclease family protein [Flavobacteriales bacterium]NQZ34834.1 PD-(D/E)XK nuclease family protein [Crocinitomicaceae bacterium]